MRPWPLPGAGVETGCGVCGRVRAGGSIPIVAKLGLSGAPVLLTGIGLPDDGLHSPNEKVDVQQVWDGIRVFGRFFEMMGEAGRETGDGRRES